MRISSLLFTAASLSLFASAASASAGLEDNAETVVVTATRIPTPELEIASSISVVTADEIAARQLQSLPDLLKEVPGLNVIQSGGPGGLTSVFMRGTNSNHTKVLVDGIDVSDPSSPGGNFDFGPFQLQDVQKVEILRGPQSGLYGSDAIGGVINIITQEGVGPAQFTARAEAGSFDTFDQSGSVLGSIDRFHYAATLEHMHSGATPVTPLDLLVSGERRIDDYDDNLTGSTKLKFDVTEDFDLGLVGRYTDSHLRLTGENYAGFPAAPDSAQSANDTRQYYTRATGHVRSLGGTLDQTLGLAYSNIKSFETSPENPESDFFGARVKVDWQGTVRIAADDKLVLGAEHQRDEMTVPISAGTKIDSGYAELQSSFGSAIFNTVSVRYDDNDRFGGKATYRVAPAYVIQQTGTKLKASLGTGFKAPTLSQMFQNFPGFFPFFGNPDLKPESSLGFDAGFEQAAAGDAVRFGVTYFRNNIKNLITENVAFTSFANIGRAVTAGVESFVAYRATPELNLRLDYTYTQATDEVVHEELLRRPKHKASLSTAWQATRRVSLTATVLSVSSWIDGNRDFSIQRLTAPGYTTVDLAANFELTGHLTLYGRVNNLLDRHYESPVGFLQPPRGAFAGIRARF